MGDSTFLHKEPCPQCGSRDNLGRYSDGHGHCFGCGYYESPEGGTNAKPEVKKVSSDLIQGGDIRALEKRKLHADTCEKFGYRVAEYKGVTYQVAPYFSEGKLVAQHLRTPGKEFSWRGDSKVVELFGQHLWRDGGKMVVVTEGEIDCMTVSQLQGNKWPVVSVPNGAQSAKKHLANNLEWLNRFETVVLMFDMDEPGKKAAAECAQLFPPGRCKIASLPLKDPNEMLQKGRGAEVIDAIWGAKTYRPDGIVTLDELRAEVMRDPEQGLPWWTPTMTSLTFGRRHGEVYTFGAGTGIGKTDFFTQQITYDLTVLKQPVAVFYLEQQPAETAKRIAGKLAGKRFHVPDGSWKPEELRAAYESLQQAGALYLYDHFGSCDWDSIRDRIRFLAHSAGVRLFYLDHLTALASEAEDERKELEKIMAQVGSLVKELDVVLHLVSHLATPEGKPHEEGGRVMIRHFKGSRAIGFWSHYMIGFERDQQAKDAKVRQTTTVRILKDRYTGQATGKVFYLGYAHDDGRLFETEAPEKQEGTGDGGGDDF